ncbi:hypothetical protein ILUMI_02520 [Ignelater luminosus]|uniref:Uncharacterized protein n=1 Tax=Ignelater luminosus TaxID=2038154 RepID=A0A8K0DCK3_IGNLU|nr:hypothetical protein ILUMI_02520 [Ignelater luminosus]
MLTPRTKEIDETVDGERFRLHLLARKYPHPLSRKTRAILKKHRTQRAHREETYHANKRVDNLIPMTIYRRHYKHFLGANRQERQEEAEEIDYTNVNNEVTVIVEEVHISFKKMKAGRSPGAENIPVELLKAGGHVWRSG